MANSRILCVGLLTASSWFSTGCITLIGPEDLRLAVSAKHHVRLDREFCISVDGLTASIAASFAPTPVPIRDITWVDVGIYNINEGQSEPTPPFVSKIDMPGWEPIVTIRDGDDETTVLTRGSGDAIRALVVFARSGDELVIARVNGRIDRMIEGFIDSENLGQFGWQGLANMTDSKQPFWPE